MFATIVEVYVLWTSLIVAIRLVYFIENGDCEDVS